MNVADRIQNLRKTNGMSQEELADKIGVSRQAVSKWESNQSLPDIEKIIMLSEYFGVTTDFILKGTETKTNTTRVKWGARVCAITGTGLNFIGLVLSILIWLEKQSMAAVAVGLIIMVFGCMFFAIGQLNLTGANKKSAAKFFVLVNIWFLSLIPISCVFNFIQGTLGGYWWTLTPIPQLGNSFMAYILCWLIYIGICTLVDVIIVVKKK